MVLHIIGSCGNCQSLTSRFVGGAYHCRACLAKGVKPVESEKEKKIRKNTAADLPRNVEDALADAKYIPRSPADDGFPRVVARIAGLGDFMLGGEDGDDVSSRIERAWPKLTDVQIRRVLRYIDAGAAAAIRAATERPGRPKKCWVTDY